MTSTAGNPADVDRIMLSYLGLPIDTNPLWLKAPQKGMSSLATANLSLNVRVSIGLGLLTLLVFASFR